MRRVCWSFCVILLVTSIFAPACGGGQIEVVQDPFSGPQRRFHRAVGPGSFGYIEMWEGQGKYGMQVCVGEFGQSHTVGQQGDKSQFKIGDNTLTLETAAQIKPVTYVGNVVWTTWVVTFDLTRQDMVAFSQASLTAIKVSLGEKTLQFAVSGRDGELIRKNAGILANPG